MAYEYEEYNGIKFIECMGTDKHNKKKWKLQCHCGKEFIAIGTAVKRGNTKSCGCTQYKRTHNKTKSKLYKVWINMKSRCNNPNTPNYNSYGGRGILICDEWMNDFNNFYNWSYENGYQEGLSIDRIDNDGNYESGNCRWADIPTQNNNQRKTLVVVVDGEKMSLKEYSVMVDVPYSTLKYRYHKGKDLLNGK